MVNYAADAQIAHVKWILYHDSMQLVQAHRIDENLAGVKANESNLARLADILERQQHSGSR